MSKDELERANEFADQKNKKIIKDIIDPFYGLFIDDQLKPNEQNIQNTTDNVFNLPPQVQQQLDETTFKKIINHLKFSQLHLKLFQMLFQKLKIFLLTMMNLIHLKSLKQRQ